MIDSSFWHGKRVLLTGHTGFKGGWLSIWLASLGSQVRGYSLEPNSSPSLFNEANVGDLVDSQIGDIRDKDLLHASMAAFNPDIVIHMAAQSLVRYSYDEPVETYEVNVIGTVNVLEAVRTCSRVKAVVIITTDKCYENDERSFGYSENDPMGGYDPYSSSKGCAELVTSAYRRSFLQERNVCVATVRAGNVIGGGDWAANRLIPDILRSFEKDECVLIRNPDAVRPWQHVLEPLSGYLILAQKLYDGDINFAEGWNFGPNDQDAKPVSWILDKMIKHWSNASWMLDQESNSHEANVLKLDISKAQSKLRWYPTWNLEYTLEKIIKWHQAWQNQENMQEKCLDEIKEYVRSMR